jgi:N-acetyl sugar amidotransferase
MDDTVEGIRFDEKGECTFCKIHDELEKKFPLNEGTPKRLQLLVEKIKKNGKGKRYDCIIGVSGGRDSTFTLYNAVKLGLRPLAVHFDNGWNSEIAVQNIKTATDKLGVDLYTHVADWEEFKDLQKAFLRAAVSDGEVPTDWVITSVLYRTAVKEDVKYSIQGSSFRTEGTAPLTWTYQDGRYIKNIFKKFGKGKHKSFPIMNLSQFLYYTFIKRIKSIRLLYYIPYNEKAVLEILKSELGWNDYGGKHFESTYTTFYQSYILIRKFNIDKRKMHFSALIRSNQLTREHALEKLLEDPFKGGTESIIYNLKKLNLTESEFNEMMNSENKSFRDYPSYYNLIRKLEYPIRFGIKFGLIPEVVIHKYFNR